MISLLLILSAILPALLFLIFIYRKDLHKEPRRLLLKSYLIGMILVLPILGTEILLSQTPPRGEISVLLYNAFIVAALSEEGWKLLLLARTTWHSPELDEPIDGIVYAVFVGLGFATVENILYVLQQGFSTSLLRALFSVPGHGLFGVVMGYFYAQARFAPTRGKRMQQLALALLLPIAFHGSYNYLIFQSASLIDGEAYLLGALPVVAYLALFVALWLVALRFIRLHTNVSK
ncbi:PrsW family glutamic-type intramembrane protease [uncultured Porphyromonas sp.]|uniref:PrsW family glutamic-type intramembrane protease n=1 Tax=uncultured Porphyromonas sp. TaxID=159274 RepID=UPI00262C04DE|nr:PrsW family glutamic-type intramembrane protease [uncultured Porphyromonas sp.]